MFKTDEKLVLSSIDMSRLVLSIMSAKENKTKYTSAIYYVKHPID